MKKLLMATAATALMAGAAQAEDVKIGILLGFTGPLESLAPDMAAGAEPGDRRESTSPASFWTARPSSRCTAIPAASTPASPSPRPNG